MNLMIKTIGIFLLIMSSTLASSASAAAKEPEEIWQELLKLSNNEWQRRPVAGARAEGKLVYQVGHVFTLQMHIVDKQHTRGVVSRRLLRYRRKRPALLEQVPAQVGARTRLSQEFQAYKLPHEKGQK
jgi:hypothetical protein